jgi:hypothetical protein
MADYDNTSVPSDDTGVPSGDTSVRSRALRQLTDIGGRAATATLRPLGNAAGAAIGAGINLERRAVDRVLDGPELDRLLTATLDSPRTRAVINRAVASDAAKQLIASVFDTGLFDELVDRLLASRGLWRLIDEVAGSPAVMEAVTQQGLGFADPVGEEVRSRSRGADDWLERAARRLTGRRARTLPPTGEDLSPEMP